MDKVASISHDVFVHRSKFIKSIMSHNHTQSIYGDKGANQSIPTCHHCGLTTDPQIFCSKATIDDSELWHRRLGHLNFSDMLKIAGKDIVKDLPKMERTRK
jgi:hypothetical protein